MAEREAEIVVDSIRDSIFCDGNMIGVDFLNSKGNPLTITNPDHRPDDITYLNFRTTVNPHIVDIRAPDSVDLFECSLRLPNTSLIPSPLSLLPHILSLFITILPFTC